MFCDGNRRLEPIIIMVIIMIIMIIIGTINVIIIMLLFQATGSMEPIGRIQMRTRRTLRGHLSKVLPSSSLF